MEEIWMKEYNSFGSIRKEWLRDSLLKYADENGLDFKDLSTVDIMKNYKLWYFLYL